MKWVLVDKYDNIKSRAELHSGYGKKSAKKYFVDKKNLDESSFDKIWRVMSEEEYEAIQRSSLQNKQYEWWKDEESYLDIDKP